MIFAAVEWFWLCDFYQDAVNMSRHMTSHVWLKMKKLE